MLTAARTTPVHPGDVIPAAVLPPGCRHQYSGRNSRGSGLFTHLSPRSSYPEGPGANHAEDSRLCIAAAYAVVLSSYCSICVCEVVQRWAFCVHEDNQGISVSKIAFGCYETNSDTGFGSRRGVTLFLHFGGALPCTMEVTRRAVGLY